MRSELARKLEEIGWEELYGRHFAIPHNVNQKGEVRAASPFPYLLDNRPSFSLNVNTGLWHCFVQGKGGDYVMFRSLLETAEFDPTTGWGIPDYEATQRKLLKEFNLTKTIDGTWLKQVQENLLSDPTLSWGISQHKPWEIHTMSSMGLGYDYEHERFTIPIYDRRGSLVNVKMYRPGQQDSPKMVWLVSGVGGNYLFPSRGWTDPWVILVEGETDVLSLRGYGYPAVSGTAGGGDPVPDGDWWRGKSIFILMDEDSTGDSAKEKAIYRMRELATSIAVCYLPSWEGKPPKADVSDYIMYLKSIGQGVESIQAAIGKILTSGEMLAGQDSSLDEEAVDCTFAKALSATNLNKKVRFKTRLLARSANKYILPTEYEVRCPATGQQWCRRCPMSNIHRGIGVFRHDFRRQESLRFVQCSSQQQIAEIKSLNGIAKQCPEPVTTTLKSKDIEVCMIGESTHESDSGNHERARREAYFICIGPQIEENKDYEVEAYVYAHPKTQQAVFFVTSYVQLGNAFENFKVDASCIDRLSIFKPAPNQHSYDKIMEVCNDLAESVTLIKGRADLHAAYRCVFHSALSFDLGGERIKRGWLEALVIGDTRCGKSKAYQGMANHYGVGVLVDCKMQTIAGILGSVQQAPSGEFYVLAGLLPQNDGGVACFDEFASRKGGDMIGALSSTRAEGVVRINKAASGEFKSRVRTIWLANPGLGELMSELPDSGIELIPRIIPQPEDIARFDFAVTVSQEEVPSELVNMVYTVPPPIYGTEVSKELIKWVYSRDPSQIKFTPEALDYLVSVSAWLSERYDPSIPIVEINDQKTRVAKLSVSVAAQLFSTTDGENLIVLPEHVETACKLFVLWYDKPSMGYFTHSNWLKAAKKIRNPDDVQNAFDVAIAPYGKRLAEILLKIDEINPREFQSYVPMNSMYASTFVGRLNVNNCLRPIERGKKAGYRKTAEFTKWLKNYLGHDF